MSPTARALWPMFVVALIACGCPAPRQHAPAASPSPSPPRPPDQVELVNVTAISLASTTPPGLSLDSSKRVILARRVAFGSTLVGGEWRTSARSVEYAA